MKPYLALVALVSSICAYSCASRPSGSAAREHISTIEQLVDAKPAQLHSPERWSEDILTVSNCIKTNGAPKDVIHKGDTVTLVYGADSTMELVYVRDTLYCEVFE